MSTRTAKSAARTSLCFSPPVTQDVMSSKEILHWFLVYLVPYALIGLLSSGAGLIVLPLGGTFGIIHGLTSSVPYFSVEVRIFLLVACLVSISLFIFGYKKRKKLWGKVINAASVYLWCVIGLLGIGLD